MWKDEDIMDMQEAKSPKISYFVDHHTLKGWFNIIIITLLRHIMYWDGYLTTMIDWFLVFNATFSNISAISWWPVFVVEEAGENHRPWANTW